LFSSVDPELPGVRHSRHDHEAFCAALADADAVVSSAGHQLISECLQLGIPHLALYDQRDDEQHLNAQLLQLSNLGDAACFDRVDRATVLHFLGRLPELERLRQAESPLARMPALETVLLELLAKLPRAASTAARLAV
jgi:UDP:flavonoid glycosyltransferase YjiC (YdhE family)